MDVLFMRMHLECYKVEGVVLDGDLWFGYTQANCSKGSSVEE